MISIDPLTHIISIPKADLTLIQSSPTEIRELNINAFRLELKAWEASIEGAYMYKTHEHNTEVSLGGLTFARVVEILDPYSITFEDGQYAVNLTGANSNIGDKVNVNQVSVRSANSAGLISSPDIEFASFNGGVIIDTVNGFSGTLFPTGTERRKSNNVVDALLIADYRGFSKIYLHSDLTLGADAQLENFIVEGLSHVQTDVIIDAAADVTGVSFVDVSLDGTLDGNNSVEYCVVGDITYLNGHIHNSSLGGKITLGGNEDAYIAHCNQLDMNVIPEIDMGGSGQDLVMPDYAGIVEITNLTGANKVGIGLNGGRIILDSTSVTGGLIHAAGIGQLLDENGNRILSGTWNGGVTIINELLNTNTIAEGVSLIEGVYVDATSGITGTEFPKGSKRLPVDNLTDAITIAAERQVSNIIFVGDYTFPNTTNISGYTLRGSGWLNSTFTFVSGCLIVGCILEDATCTGYQSGAQEFNRCLIQDLGSVGVVPSSNPLEVHKCYIDGTITFPSNYSGKVTVVDSYSYVVGATTPTVDFSSSTANMQLRNYTGGIKFKNVDQANVFSIDFVSGQCKLESTVTSATFVVRGAGKLIDFSTGEFIDSGTWNGGVTIYNEANNPEYTGYKTWEQALDDHKTSGTTGDHLRRVKNQRV